MLQEPGLGSEVSGEIPPDTRAMVETPEAGNLGAANMFVVSLVLG
jgi:hypothetical protein